MWKNMAEVVSTRIYDNGWREKTPEESAIGLSHEQKLSLVSLLSKGRRAQTIRAIEAWADKPHLYPGVKHWMLERLTFDGDRASYCAGQDYPAELNQIIKAIRGATGL